jgi:competence ComEA-like helix-hairpin-helix protein
MKTIERLQETFGFTRNELKVILFLAGTLAAGAGIRWIMASRQPVAGAAFNYSTMDREFADRSRRPPAAAAVTPGPQPPAATISVNLNTASRAELMLLPGIGEKYAERIVAYRHDHGPFASIEELDRVKGIGPKTLERLKPFIRIR